MTKQPSQLSRRQFIKGSLLTVGATALASCTAPSNPAASPSLVAPTVIAPSKLVITTAGWPLAGMPSAEEAAADSGKQVYADFLQTWLNENPNVTLETVEAPIWNPSGLRSAIVAGTAPTYFLSNVVGNWSLSGTRTAFAQGLLADLTDSINATSFKSQLIDPIRRAYERTGHVSGRAFYMPIDIAMEALWYRRDLAEERVLALPSVDWSWDDFRAFLSRMTNDQMNGLGAAHYFLEKMLQSYGFGLFTNVPDLESEWHWARDFSDPLWADVVADYRQMLHEDGSITSEQGVFSDAPYRDTFRAGGLGSIYTNVRGAFNSAREDFSFAGMARENNKSFEQLLGFVPLPKGSGYMQSGMLMSGGVAMPPETSPELAAKAIDLVNFIYFGEPADAAKVTLYEQTNDLKAVYADPLPINGKFEYAGVDGTFADAWGERIFEEVQTILGMPPRIAEDLSFYFPTEELGSPDNGVIDAMWQKLVYQLDIFDIGTEMVNSQTEWNEQAATFPSSVTRANFQQGIERYYADVIQNLRENAPDFYEQRFRGWFEETIRPKLALSAES